MNSTTDTDPQTTVIEVDDRGRMELPPGVTIERDSVRYGTHTGSYRSQSRGGERFRIVGATADVGRAQVVTSDGRYARLINVDVRFEGRIIDGFLSGLGIGYHLEVGSDGQVRTAK